MKLVQGLQHSAFMKRYKGKSQIIAGGIGAVGALALAVALWPNPTPITHAENVPAWSLEPISEPDNAASKELRSEQLFAINVIVTGYSSTRGQTDSTPFVTASNTRVRKGIVALSRDLLRRYTPGAPFAFGDRVLIPGVGEFVVEDTMNKRFSQRVDIWFASRSEARHWGHQAGHSLVKLLALPEAAGTDVSYAAEAMAE
jgi:3D (Asp-Asp-Asp) domain-containing protein